MSEDLPINLVPKLEVVTPRLPGHVILRPDADGLIDALLADLAIHSRNCVRAFGDFHLAISATEQAEPYLRRLMYDPAHRDFPWNRTRVWMVDELALPPDDPTSRFARLRDLVLEQSGIPAEQVHRLEPTTEGAAAYEAELRQHLGWREKGHDRLDFVLLALDELGGVGGLAKAKDDASLIAPTPSQPGEPQFSMTLQFINASRVVAVIAGGAANRPAIASLTSQARAGAPPLGLSPLAGELRWYVDYAACQARREA